MGGGGGGWGAHLVDLLPFLSRETTFMTSCLLFYTNSPSGKGSTLLLMGASVFPCTSLDRFQKGFKNDFDRLSYL